ncbi:MAG TPA: DUF3891 family protein [Thermomicrobiales bacterium]|nr:DUF3891 family protein [Thermomicrobiales bacterium]
MQFREGSGERYVVTQPTHAWVSGQLARAWGNDRFGSVEPRGDVCLGAELHDIGWLDWEREPTLNETTGLPHSFMQLPTALHLSIWGQASSLARPFGRYASLLVSMHGTGLYAFHDYERDTEDEARAARAYVERELEYQQSVISQLAADPMMADFVTPEVIARNRRLVGVWDAMSLAICGGITATRVIRDVPSSGAPLEIAMNPAGANISVSPWPFMDDTTCVRFEARRISGTFADVTEMRLALSFAEWKTFDVTLCMPRSG